MAIDRGVKIIKGYFISNDVTNMEPIIRKEIMRQLEEIKSIVENDVHPAVSPDNWYVYSNLHDELEQLTILLERNNVV